MRRAAPPPTPSARAGSVRAGGAASLLSSVAACACSLCAPGDALAQEAPNAAVVDPAPDPVDVTVTGDKTPPGATKLKRRDIRDMPGVLGDPYRGIELEPSVTPAASGVPYYFIRGAPPGNVGYFYDGIQVPLLFHAGAGPCVIPASIVQGVELHLGAYPAAYGRLAGAVIEAEATAPRHAWRGEAVFRGVDLGGLIEGPIGKAADFAIGGHYSVGTKILNAIVPAIDIDYADYQGRVTIENGESGRFTLTTFGSYDYLGAGEGDEKDVLIDSDFHRVDVRYDDALRGGGKAQVAMTLGLDRSRGQAIDGASDYRLEARARIEKPTKKGVLVRAGAQASLDGYDNAIGEVDCTTGKCGTGILGLDQGELAAAFKALFPSRMDVAIGGWADAVIALDERSTLTPGVRVDYFTSMSASDVAVDPRLVGSFGIGDHVKLVPAIGVASQLPGFAPIPALQIGGIPGGLQRSVQQSFGVYVNVEPIDARATVYKQSTFNLTDAIGIRGDGFGTARFLQRTTGDSYGLELSVKGAFSKDIFFVGAYTLSRSTRDKDGRTIPSAFDRTHMAQFALLFDLGNGWKAGARNVFYTGFPADEAGPGRLPSEHPDRTPPFYRLDIRLAKRWVWPKGTYVGLVFDMQNATLAREVYDVKCTDDGCEPRYIGPITIPTLNLEAGF